MLAKSLSVIGAISNVINTSAPFADMTMFDDDPDRRQKLRRMVHNELTLIARAALMLGAALLILEGLLQIAAIGKVAPHPQTATPAAAAAVNASPSARR